MLKYFKGRDHFKRPWFQVQVLKVAAAQVEFGMEPRGFRDAFRRDIDAQVALKAAVLKD